MCALLCWLIGSGSAHAQTCALPSPAPRVAHAFPTQAPDTLPFVTTNAFPQLSFFAPISLRSQPGDATRVFVAEQRGVISAIPNTPTTT